MTFFFLIIIKCKWLYNLINIFYNKGSSREDLLVAIGPSISKKYYLIDSKNLQNFYKQISHKEIITSTEDERILIKNKTPLNLKKYANIQLLTENIPNSNIDISNLCTYESNYDFYSWRRSKTPLRQWNFISS